MKPHIDVIYNDTCPICAREIAAYRDYTGARAIPVSYLGLSGTDLSSGDWAALGLTPDQAARRLHVVQDGRLLAGVEAFAELWARMPRMAWAAWLLRRPLVLPLTHLLYEGALAPLLYRLHLRRQRRLHSARG